VSAVSSPAFTLTEMLVALAVMVLVMAMVTTVFSVTTKTAATSAAIADVEAIVRTFADQLEQDLRYCVPSRSVLVIHGRTQAAALTDAQRQAGQYYRVMTGDPGLVPAGYDPRFDTDGPGGSVARDQYSDPRADILMFFTDRAMASKAPAISPLANDIFQDRLYRGARVAPIQVVYGHAALDKAVQTGGGWQFANDLTHIETSPATDISPLPANRWHLARRQVLLEEPAASSGYVILPQFTDSDFDRVLRCYSTDDRYAADAVQFSLPRYLREFAPFVNPSGQLMGQARRSPYLFPDLIGDTFSSPGHIPWLGTDAQWVDRVLYAYGDERYHHVATVIEHPPGALADNLGLHLAPGCVWFQVELLIPEDPRNGLEDPLSDQRRDTPRWVEVDAGQTYVFVPDTEENRHLIEAQALQAPTNVDSLTGDRVSTFKKLVPDSVDLPPYQGLDTIDNRRIRMWPYAIRVTVRVIDQRGRLEEPIVRSVVHRFD
jgi:type II secretory pathway pseudopilin PulG